MDAIKIEAKESPVIPKVPDGFVVGVLSSGKTDLNGMLLSLLMVESRQQIVVLNPRPLELDKEQLLAGIMDDPRFKIQIKPLDFDIHRKLRMYNDDYQIELRRKKSEIMSIEDALYLNDPNKEGPRRPFTPQQKVKRKRKNVLARKARKFNR